MIHSFVNQNIFMFIVHVIIINVYSSNEKVIMSDESLALALRCATIAKGYSMLIGCQH